MPTPNFFKSKALRDKRTAELRSCFEDEVCEDLKKRGLSYRYEPRDVRLPYVTKRHYIPDLVLPNGIIVELKGYFTEEDRSKMLRVREHNPDATIRFVFQNWNSPVEGARARKDGTKMTCREWCDENDFICANKKIPDAWYNE